MSDIWNRLQALMEENDRLKEQVSIESHEAAGLAAECDEYRKEIKQLKQRLLVADCAAGKNFQPKFESSSRPGCSLCGRLECRGGCFK